MNTDKSYGFWHSDIFPYLMSGVINPSDHCSYDPAITLSFEEGLKLKQKLLDLESEYRKAQHDLEQIYNKKAKDVFLNATNINST